MKIVVTIPSTFWAIDGTQEDKIKQNVKALKSNLKVTKIESYSTMPSNGTSYIKSHISLKFDNPKYCGVERETTMSEMQLKRFLKNLRTNLHAKQIDIVFNEN